MTSPAVGPRGNDPPGEKRNPIGGKGFGPPTPFYVSAYHMLVVVIVILIALCLEKRFVPSIEWYHQIYALLGGGLGGTVTASRWVVLAVRHGEYDPRRLLWQLLTPIYSGALGWVGIIAIRGGLLTLSESPSTKEPNFTYFVIAFSFLVGFASEAFLKRLILAAQTLFGEHREDVKEIEAEAGRDETEPNGREKSN
jgi:hypothetical protein